MEQYPSTEKRYYFLKSQKSNSKINLHSAITPEITVQNLTIKVNNSKSREIYVELGKQIYLTVETIFFIILEVGF